MLHHDPQQQAAPAASQPRFRIVDFAEIPGVPCPCGIARRAFTDDPVYPGTVHRTDIDRTAEPHYHQKLTELYYVISCEPGAVLRLDDEQIPLHADMLILILPNVVHCLIGVAKLLIVVLPKFDPSDEFIVREPVH